MEDVRHKDELRVRNFKRAKKKAVAREAKKPKIVKGARCCLDRHDDLPASFLMCIDCPKRKGNETNSANLQET